MKQVIQDIINLDRHVLPIDYKPKSFEKILFTGSEEDCKLYIKSITIFYYN